MFVDRYLLFISDIITQNWILVALGTYVNIKPQSRASSGERLGNGQLLVSTRL